MDDSVSFVIYDQADAFRRLVVAKSSSTTLLRNEVSFTEFVLDADHPALPDATVSGARCGFRFRGREWFRGRVAATPGHGPVGETTIRVESDVRKLWDWHGRPVPGAAVTAQVAEYARYSGPTETIAKAAMAANFARLGVAWSVAPNLGRGPAARLEFRFHPLADKIVPLLDAAHLVLDVTYADHSVIVDVREAQLVAGVLSDLTGKLEAYSWTRDAPTATRVVVGGRGEGVEREFLEKVNEELEAEWGDIIETFVDARNTEEGSTLEPDADEALVAGLPTAGVSMDLIETDAFRFAQHFLVGDRVRVRVGPLDQLEAITQVQIADSPEGVVVTPKLGTADDDPDVQLGRQVALLARGARDEKRR